MLCKLKQQFLSLLAPQTEWRFTILTNLYQVHELAASVETNDLQLAIVDQLRLNNYIMYIAIYPCIIKVLINTFDNPLHAH